LNTLANLWRNPVENYYQNKLVEEEEVNTPLKKSSILKEKKIEKKFKKKIQKKNSKNFKFHFIEKLNNTEFDRYISNSKLQDSGMNNEKNIERNVIPAAITNTKKNQKILMNHLSDHVINAYDHYNYTEILHLNITFMINIYMYSCPYGYSGYSKLYKNSITDIIRNVSTEEYPLIGALYPYLSADAENFIFNNISVMYNNITTYKEIYLTCQTPINILTTVQTDYLPSPKDSIKLNSNLMLLTDYIETKSLNFYESFLTAYNTDDNYNYNTTDDFLNIFKNITLGGNNSYNNNTNIYRNHTHPLYLSINTKIEKLKRIKNQYLIDDEILQKNTNNFTDLPSVLFGVNIYIYMYIYICMYVYACTHSFMLIFSYIYANIYRYAYIRVNMYVYIHVYTCIFYRFADLQFFYCSFWGNIYQCIYL
jgi:hypothetical protein